MGWESFGDIDSAKYPKLFSEIQKHFVILQNA